MSDAIKHECGIAFMRLKKPLQHYTEKYGTPFFALRKMYLLMEKQHNRGQDGAGLANIKLNVPPGEKYISRYRSNSNKSIQDVFEYINKRFKHLETDAPEKLLDAEFLKHNYAFTGEVFLGHLRYGTFGGNSIEQCHPFLRQNNWKTRNLVVAGNFNLTNVDELFSLLVELGQHPKERADTVTVMEKIGHFLDMENEELFRKYKLLGYSNIQISELIAKNLNVAHILKRASTDWDGGYVMAGMMGHGDAFVLRDPAGIRPAYYYDDDELTVVASERPVIQTTFNVPINEVKELDPGHAVIVKCDGTFSLEKIIEPIEKKACSFERIYFSRGSDQDIYRERIELGRIVSKQVLESINYDLSNSVFSFIPNTAEVSFYGLVKGIEEYQNEEKLKQITNMVSTGNQLNSDELHNLLMARPRVEKIAIKDAKLRTFITVDDERDDFVAHVYDITYGTVNEGADTLVAIDDSIVRGTTLRKSILKMLDRLNPKKIIIVSSAPQIRYPDCYGINMSILGDFIAFEAAIALLKENGMEHIIKSVYEKSLAQVNLPKEQVVNYVKEIYEPFTYEQVSQKISELLKPADINAEVEIIYQTVEGLHAACPQHSGDWYFTGNYPTPGGNKVVTKAFINYFEGKKERAY